MSLPTALEPLAVEVGEVKPHPDNARQHASSLLKESLEAHGQFKPLVVQESTGYVLAGNGILAAALELGWESVAAVHVAVDDEQARRILAVDNRASDLGTYDDEALAALLSDLPDLSATGYTPDDLDDLMAALGSVEVLPPQPTQAHYAETPEEEQERADRLAQNVPIVAKGMRDLIVLLTFEDYDRAVRIIAGLKKARGEGTTTGAVVMAALEDAAEKAEL